MVISRSDDGGSHWSAAKRFAVGTPALQKGSVAIRSSPQVPSFAIDSRGTLYGVWQDSRFSRGAHDDVLFTRSSDGGAHWRGAVRISPSSAAAAIIPTISAGAAGRIAVLYLQLAAGDSLPAVYHLAVSSDGGRHFRDGVVSAPFAVSDAPRLMPSPLVPGGYFLGDYMGVAPLGRAGFGAVYVSTTQDARNRTDVSYIRRR